MWWKQFLVMPVALSFLLGGSSPQASKDDCLASLSDKDLLAHRLVLRSEVNPQSLYKRVWNLIKDEYYDSKYNNQSWDRWEHRYDGKLRTLDDAHKAVETMVASLGDRYTRFLDHDAFDDEKSQIDAKLCGIGVQIGLDKSSKRVIVITPIEDTPASDAGVQPSDEILEINGKSTKGFTVEDAAKLIRGPVNTPVHLVLGRAGARVKKDIVRREIPIKAVQSVKMIDPDVGYVRLSSFISQKANLEMQTAIDKIDKMKAKGLILDLRDNPGGLLSNAIEISNMFLESGNVVSTVDRDGYKTPAMCEGHPLWRKPLVVLINKNSASASEITAGALHDNGRATLVGQNSFGKGLVQGINRLEDGSGINITIAQYLTPADTNIHKKGIRPDVVVEVKSEDESQGPWWNEHTPGVLRSPLDGKDLQLKSAAEVCHKKIEEAEKLASEVH
ncbi:MAG TPA: S41 family peptidase [Candidatus Obscuribacter sp.]|nr:S41 family peptidase [Candidatus Obscuribacter sp.]HNB17952.1 S41 family peptidase [Candidatus Obscuribacter sp.]HND04417.1 S41 family peptidase [Candidatus Obscuribacter sp.]HND67751.1 S41 family peptidase [Candidatus Obscuribacter sp.]HNG18464.1 S41 family peptidase [Candidatus Obscuribacter sp.]